MFVKNQMILILHQRYFQLYTFTKSKENSILMEWATSISSKWFPTASRFTRNFTGNMVTQKCVTICFFLFGSALTTHVLLLKTAIYGKKIGLNAKFVGNGSMNLFLWPKFLLILFRIRLYWLIVPRKFYFFEIIYFFFMHDRDGWTKCSKIFPWRNGTDNLVGLIKLHF